ncbi:Uncharacterised protein [Vibrio cholerae]|nr:Uncharacterised protein [Vibrio cholerae]CSB85130.1 Uncharacterised protein [Vibrio cholerae]
MPSVSKPHPIRWQSSSIRGQLFGWLTSIAFDVVATVGLGSQRPVSK